MGAGAAGISLAREFLAGPLSVALIESGGFEADRKTQALYEGESVGQAYFPLHQCRTRLVGGSTSCWAGIVAPLDAIDFEARDWVPHSGWPITRADLDPHYERAHRLLGLGPFRYDGKYWVDDQSPALPLGRLDSRVFQVRAGRFGTEHREAFAKSSNVRLYTHANLLDIETPADGARVSGLSLATLSGVKLSARARAYVLATGGIENARLLLAARSRRSAGLGNEHGLVGRYFMEHPHVDDEGVIVITRPGVNTGFFGVRMARGVQVWGHLALSPEVLREERLLNFGSVLLPRKAASGSFAADLGRAAGNLDTWWALQSGGLGGSDPAGRVFALGNPCEQAPNPDSRVTLGGEKDALGMPRSVLDWRLGALDKRSLRRVHEVMGLEIARAGIGRMQVTLSADDRSWPPQTRGGFHHMGTTRMHADPKRGVVDAQCRVHSLANLFVAGSSVFTTCGAANPTLTIIALATRLGDHLRKEVLS